VFCARFMHPYAVMACMGVCTLVCVGVGSYLCGLATQPCFAAAPRNLDTCVSDSRERLERCLQGG